MKTKKGPCLICQQWRALVKECCRDCIETALQNYIAYYWCELEHLHD